MKLLGVEASQSPINSARAQDGAAAVCIQIREAVTKEECLDRLMLAGGWT